MTGPVATDGRAVPGWLRDVPFAHRGLHGDGIVENTRTAFTAAADAGYGVELDVRLSADGVPMVFHDVTLRRMAGVSGAVHNRRAADLAGLRLGGARDGVPSLADALMALRDVPVMVELKTTRPRAGALESEVAAVLDDHAGPACVASLNPTPLRWFRRARPAVPRVLAAMAPLGPGIRARFLRYLGQLRAAQDIMPAAISYQLEGLPNPAVDRWRAAGGLLVTWTVTTDAQLDRARQLADNVIFEAVRPVLRTRDPSPRTDRVDP